MSEKTTLESFTEMREWNAASAKVMVRSILREFGLGYEVVIDLGSGPGCHANEFKRQGAKLVFALDSAPEARGFLDEKIVFIEHDLRQPWVSPCSFDVVTCFEVLEHIDSRYEEIVLDSIVGSVGGYLVVTAAGPGQDGCGHVNCKPVEYWKQQFMKRGLLGCSALAVEWQREWREEGVVYYYVDNLMVFER